MRMVVLYHPKGEFAGMAEDYKRDFEYQHPGKKIEMVSLETINGAEMAKLYDVVRYPALLAIENDGRLRQIWQDKPWPLMDEAYAYSQ